MSLEKKATTTTEPGNLQAYDELKKRLLSEYKKLTNNLRSLRDKIDVLKEEGYNLRAELRSLK